MQTISLGIVYLGTQGLVHSVAVCQSEPGFEGALFRVWLVEIQWLQGPALSDISCMNVALGNFPWLISQIWISACSNSISPLPINTETLIFPLSCIFFRYWANSFILMLAVWASSSGWMSLQVLTSRWCACLVDSSSVTSPHFCLPILPPKITIQIFKCLDYCKVIALSISTQSLLKILFS